MTSHANETLVIFNRLVYLLPTVVLLVGCVVYLGKNKSIEAVLMLAGQALLLVGGIISTVFIALISSGAVAHRAAFVFTPIMSAFSLLGGVAFAVGFIMMALKYKTPAPPAVPPTLADTAG